MTRVEFASQIVNLLQKVAELWNLALEGCALEDEAEGVVRVVDLEGDVNIAGDIPEECDEEVEALGALVYTAYLRHRD